MQCPICKQKITEKKNDEGYNVGATYLGCNCKSKRWVQDDDNPRKWLQEQMHRLKPLTLDTDSTDFRF